jgi:hypothetical protein
MGRTAESRMVRKCCEYITDALSLDRKPWNPVSQFVPHGLDSLTLNQVRVGRRIKQEQKFNQLSERLDQVKPNMLSINISAGKNGNICCVFDIGRGIVGLNEYRRLLGTEAAQLGNVLIATLGGTHVFRRYMLETNRKWRSVVSGMYGLSRTVRWNRVIPSPAGKSYIITDSLWKSREIRKGDQVANQSNRQNKMPEVKKSVGTKLRDRVAQSESSKSNYDKCKKHSQFCKMMFRVRDFYIRRVFRNDRASVSLIGDVLIRSRLSVRDSYRLVLALRRRIHISGKSSMSNLGTIARLLAEDQRQVASWIVSSEIIRTAVKFKDCSALCDSSVQFLNVFGSAWNIAKQSGLEIDENQSVEALVRNIVKASGVEIVFTTIPRIKACAIRLGERKAIFINRMTSAKQRASVLLHELGHLQLEHTGLPASFFFNEAEFRPDSRCKDEECEAHYFANVVLSLLYGSKLQSEVSMFSSDRIAGNHRTSRNGNQRCKCADAVF